MASILATAFFKLSELTKHSSDASLRARSLSASKVAKGKLPGEPPSETSTGDRAEDSIDPLRLRVRSGNAERDETGRNAPRFLVEPGVPGCVGKDCALHGRGNGGFTGSCGALML